MCVKPVADITIKSISEEDYANPLVIWNDISPVDIENDVVRCIRSFSLNNLIDGSHMQDLIPSSWGRSSATCSTHSEYHSLAMNPSSPSSPYQATFMDPKFGDLTKVEAVVPRFHGESHPVGHNRFIPPMRHISTQGVRWRYTCEHTASVELVLLSSNYDTLPSQDEMDSFASRVDLSGVIYAHLPNLTATS